MFTQCPKCQSVFMVSDENIRAHEGLVRCGNCYSVFNSSWNLTDDPRSDFVEEPISSEHAKPSASQGSGFIFNILGQKFATSHDSEGLDDQKIGESAELENQEVAETGDDSDLPDDEFLEPFPDPEVDQYLQTVKSEPEANKSQESLLYFDTDDVEEEEPVIESDSDTAEIEDLTLLQTPSFDNEIPTLNQDDSLLKPGDDENESSLITMTEESMWPGSEVSYADAGDESDLPALDISESDAESSAPDVDENLHDQPDFSIDEELLEKQLLGYISLEDPEVDEQALVDPLTEGLLTDQQSASEVQTKDPLAGVAQLDDLGDDWLLNESESGAEELLQSEDEPDDFEQIDDIFVASGKETEADEYFGLKSLPESADEAFDLELDEEDEDGAESVFITSEEDEIDDAYVPISLRLGDEGELLQGLDDFPGPGELTALNLEDTMQINAMLEAANISKDQIESALSAANISEDENDEGKDNDIAEKILLSAGAADDLAEALYSPDDQTNEIQIEGDAQSKKKNKSVASSLKNLLPLRMGRNKTLTEPVISDPEETQLIQNLNRGRGKPELPDWITKYATLAASVVLIVTLIGQIGYFYMDKLVRITPLRPLLEAGCKVAACTVPAIQNTKDIEQLSSGMSPLSGSDGGLKVSSILVNHDINSQAFPALELTLTDRAGNIISRRVVTRDKYLTETDSTEMKPNEAVDINIYFRTPSIRVDGFELRPVSQNWLERTK